MLPGHVSFGPDYGASFDIASVRSTGTLNCTPSLHDLTIYSGWCRKLLEIEQPFTLDMAGNPEKQKFSVRKKRAGSRTNGLHIPDSTIIVVEPLSEFCLEYAE